MDADQDAIWAEMPGGGLLKDLLGHWPTLHDARVRFVEFDPENDQLTLTIDYFDQPTDALTDISARILLSWSGVKSVEMDLLSDFLMNVEFKHHGDHVRTYLEFDSGGSAMILSESVDAKLSRLDPGLQDEPSMKLVYRRRA